MHRCHRKHVGGKSVRQALQYEVEWNHWMILWLVLLAAQVSFIAVSMCHTLDFSVELLLLQLNIHPSNYIFNIFELQCILHDDKWAISLNVLMKFETKVEFALTLFSSLMQLYSNLTNHKSKGA